MAPKKRKVIGTVLRSTRKVVKETVQVAVVERESQDSEDIRSNIDGLGKEPLTQEEEQEQQEYNVGVEDITNDDVLKKDQHVSVRVIPVEEVVMHEEVEEKVDRDGQSVGVPLNEEEEEQGESMSDDDGVLDTDYEKSKEGKESEASKEKQIPRESDIEVAQEQEPSKQDQDIASELPREPIESSEVTQEQEQEKEQKQVQEQEQEQEQEKGKESLEGDQKTKRKESTA